MPIDASRTSKIPLGARRVFRLATSVALALAIAYGLGMDLPYLVPMFAFMLGAAPKPPMALKGLIGLLLVLSLTLGLGLLLLPFLLHYALTGLLLVFVGLFIANYLSLNLGKVGAATLLAVGLTMITAAGTISPALASGIISVLIVAVVLSVLCQWVVYPFFPEDSDSTAQPDAPATVSDSNWLALRANLIIFPTYIFVLTNPAAYLPLLMKAVSLGQQTTMMNARDAGRELVLSTLVSGLFAILLWLGLSIAPNLWMFFLWTLLGTIYLAAKFYAVIPTRFPPSFWQNVFVTMLLLLGPAVQDSANGNDVYKAFAVRMGLFLMLTIYAWMALILLEWLRHRRINRRSKYAARKAAI